LGISAKFFQRASELALPGDSTIYAVLEALDSAMVSARFQRYGGSVLQLSLNWEQQTKIERLLADSGSFYAR